MTVRTRTAVSLSAFMSERIHGPESRSQSPSIFLFSPRLSSCVLKGENYGENKGDLYLNTESSALIYDLSDLACLKLGCPSIVQVSNVQVVERNHVTSFMR